ncbi:MAG: ribosomal-protein-alanine N-acetyltransferase [Syntrophus sp. (in: bacteria)]|nr:ribosomal-protein-alanine N-acetyltransferase [Syntrophus sp. (in: bacteria)]
MASSGELLHGVEIREMVMADVPFVAALDRAGDPDPWTENIFQHELRLPLSHTLLAVGKREEGNQVAGFITFWMVADEVQLHKIVVGRQYRRCGVGRRLLQAMTERASACGLSHATLDVRRANEAAISLYETFGYRVTTVREGYYDEAGEDALMMSAELRPAGAKNGAL